jgi:hypothetical protein
MYQRGLIYGGMGLPAVALSCKKASQSYAHAGRLAPGHSAESHKVRMKETLVASTAGGVTFFLISLCSATTHVKLIVTTTCY